jgi:hypothetical protein
MIVIAIYSIFLFPAIVSIAVGRSRFQRWLVLTTPSVTIAGVVVSVARGWPMDFLIMNAVGITVAYGLFLIYATKRVLPKARARAEQRKAANR